MNILITGAGGFAGKNLRARLEAVRDGKDRTHPDIKIDNIYLVTRQTTENELSAYCESADFVFHFAGVNRPKEGEAYLGGNLSPLSELLAALERAHNVCPVMLSSSAQASLSGRFAGSEYGMAKLKCENELFDYAERTGAKALVYRFPNIFGKWCRPDYNSAVATFCSRVANDEPIVINDRSTRLTLLSIDDLVDEMLCALEGREHRCEFDGVDPVPNEQGRYCYAPVTYDKTLGEIADTLYMLKKCDDDMMIPSQPKGSFEKKLLAAYLSYLPEEKISTRLKMNRDERGSFTELFKSADHGQVSVNVSAPGVTKGQHWHDTKWEFFVVVSGHALVRERRLGSDEVKEFELYGSDMRAVRMLPGYTHSITNLSDTQELVTVMWANECFDPARPDTFREEV